ncbi:MAG: hypothetical protein AB7G39_03175 [Alphaproteobacteria bacterium]
MLAELLEYLTTDCPAFARRHGYLREAIALRHRHRRLARAWAPHLAAAQAVVTQAIQRCARRRTALVLGSGLLADLPMDALAAGFERVLLADAVHLRPARRIAARFSNATLVHADLTGIAIDLDRLLASGWRGDPVPSPTVFLDEPGIDLVVSANLLSQLPLMPAAALARRGVLDAAARARFCTAVVAAHLAYLRRFDATVCLITDTERTVIGRDGTVLGVQDALHGAALPGGDTTWDWDFLPPGETGGGRRVAARMLGIPDMAAAQVAAGPILDTPPAQP